MRLFGSLLAATSWCLCFTCSAQWPADSVAVHRGLVYAEVGNESLRLDLFVPRVDAEEGAEVARRPGIVVYIHGGGWSRGSRRRLPTVVKSLVNDGHALASLDYRLDGLGSHPRQLHDCKGAVRWLRSQAFRYGYSAEQIVAIGGSAGGHLAMLLGVTGSGTLEGEVGGLAQQSSSVQAVVNFFGPADFAEFGRTNRSYGARYQRNRELFDSASPTHWAGDGDPPLLSLHGTADRLVPVAQSRRMATVYRKHGLPVWLHVVPDAGHGGRWMGDAVRSPLVRAFVAWQLGPARDGAKASFVAAFERAQRAVGASSETAGTGTGASAAGPNPSRPNPSRPIPDRQPSGWR